jgi:hypothetical protein
VEGAPGALVLEWRKVNAQWHRNQSAMRMELLAEHDTVDGESKIENYRAMGPAPWSVPPPGLIRFVRASDEPTDVRALLFASKVHAADCSTTARSDGRLRL